MLEAAGRASGVTWARHALLGVGASPESLHVAVGPVQGDAVRDGQSGKTPTDKKAAGASAAGDKKPPPGQPLRQQLQPPQPSQQQQQQQQRSQGGSKAPASGVKRKATAAPGASVDAAAAGNSKAKMPAAALKAATPADDELQQPPSKKKVTAGAAAGAAASQDEGAAAPQPVRRKPQQQQQQQATGSVPGKEQNKGSGADSAGKILKVRAGASSTSFQRLSNRADSPTLCLFLEAEAVPQQQLAVSQTACVLFATPRALRLLICLPCSSYAGAACFRRGQQARRLVAAGWAQNPRPGPTALNPMPGQARSQSRAAQTQQQLQKHWRLLQQQQRTTWILTSRK